MIEVEGSLLEAKLEGGVEGGVLQMGLRASRFTGSRLMHSQGA